MEFRPGGSEDFDNDDEWDLGDRIPSPDLNPTGPTALEVSPIWAHVEPAGGEKTESGNLASGGDNLGKWPNRARAHEAFSADGPCLVAKVGPAARERATERRALVLVPEGRLLSLEDTRFAVMAGNHELVCHALDAGVDVNEVLPSGWTLLMYAAVCANPALVETLLVRGASTSFANEGGYTVLMAASSPSHRPPGDALACVAKLLEHAPDSNRTDSKGMSAVMYAARDGYQDSLRLLGQHGADLNLQDKQGWTALHWAVSRGHEACAKCLKELGADPEIKTNGGFSVEELALQFGKIQTVLESYKQTESSKFVMSTNSISDARTKTLQVEIRNKLMLDDLKQFLFALDLGHLVPLFQDQKVTLRSLLTMSEQELSAVGAMHLGEQRRIARAAHETHMSKWEQGSRPNITKRPLCFEETLSMLVNMELQCNYMQSSLQYLCKHSESDLSLLKPAKVDVHCNPAEQLLEQVQCGMSAAQALQEQAALLLSAVRKCRADFPLPADFIPSRRKRRFVSAGGAAALLLLAGAALLGWKRGFAGWSFSVPWSRV